MDKSYIELFGNHRNLGNQSIDVLGHANNLLAQSCVLSFANAFRATLYDPPPLVQWNPDFAQGLGMIPSEYTLSDIGATCMLVAGSIAWVASVAIKRGEVNSIISTIYDNLQEDPAKIIDYINFFKKNPDSSVMLQTCYILAFDQFSDDDLDQLQQQLEKLEQQER
jgi:hypothetical protein